MSAQSPDTSGGHLRYYEEHGISPVRYDAGDMDAHLDRRDSLYRLLGLPPAAFRGVRVLEVAPGSGQNSLYVASCRPATYDLVEPNPAGRRDIEAAYASFGRPHTAPRLHPDRFEDYSPGDTFDIVLCENWLGSNANEVDLIAKLASLTAPGGVFVLTIVPPSGFFPNVMRKLLALRLVGRETDFEARTELLVETFGPHLATMPNMTRSHRDWVHDCMINPHYLNVALPLETVLDTIGADMEALATCPKFTPDWRWFKGLTGDARRFNDTTLAAYRANAHNFVDHRRCFPPAAESDPEDLDTTCRGLHTEACAWQAAWDAGRTDELERGAAKIGAILREIAARLAGFDAGLGAAVGELADVWSMPSLTPPQVSGMTAFAPLFGRETIYVSFTRPRACNRAV